MTTGNILYLALSLVMFSAFSVMLAWQTWQQTSRDSSKLRPEAEYRATGQDRRRRAEGAGFTELADG